MDHIFTTNHSDFDQLLNLVLHKRDKLDISQIK
jgi:hypothetical protein